MSDTDKFDTIEMQIPRYEGMGMRYVWFDNFEIKVELHDSNTIRILANKEGLKSLAAQLLTLTQDSVPAGYHLHNDDYGGLEEGSCELILERGPDSLEDW